MRKIIFILIFISVITCDMVFAKRTPPKEITPIIYNGIKYSVLHNFTPDYNLVDNPGEYIEATDIKSNKRIWLKEVYKDKINPDIETDVQFKFIESIKIENNELIIEDERGIEYYISIGDNNKNIKINYYIIIVTSLISVILLALLYFFIKK